MRSERGLQRALRDGRSGIVRGRGGLRFRKFQRRKLECLVDTTCHVARLHFVVAHREGRDLPHGSGLAATVVYDTNDLPSLSSSNQTIPKIGIHLQFERKAFRLYPPDRRTLQVSFTIVTAVFNMTWIITLGLADRAFQVSDRRFTWSDGSLFDDYANKGVCLACADARATFSYTGLAFVGSPERRTDKWLLDALVEMQAGTKPIATVVTTLEAEATDVLRSTGGIRPQTI
jgi:hypothetical protein